MLRKMCLILLAATVGLNSQAQAGIWRPLAKALSRAFDNTPVPRYEPLPNPWNPRLGKDAPIFPNRNFEPKVSIDDAIHADTTLLSDNSELYSKDARFELDQKYEAQFSVQVSAPKSEHEYESIFGSKPPRRELSRIMRQATRFRQWSGFQYAKPIGSGVNSLSIPSSRASLLSKRSTKKELLNGIRNSESKFVTIIGHNENGYLKLPSGSKVSLRNLSKFCHQVGKKCIFLSCNSNQFVGANSIGVDGLISYSDAFEATKALQLLVTKSPRLSMSQQSIFLGKALVALRSRQRLAIRIEYVSTEVGKTAAIGLVVIAVAESADSLSGKE